MYDRPDALARGQSMAREVHRHGRERTFERPADLMTPQASMIEETVEKQHVAASMRWLEALNEDVPAVHVHDADPMDDTVPGRQVEGRAIRSQAWYAAALVGKRIEGSAEQPRVEVLRRRTAHGVVSPQWTTGSSSPEA